MPVVEVDPEVGRLGGEPPSRTNRVAGAIPLMVGLVGTTMKARC